MCQKAIGISFTDLRMYNRQIALLTKVLNPYVVSGRLLHVAPMHAVFKRPPGCLSSCKTRANN